MSQLKEPSFAWAQRVQYKGVPATVTQVLSDGTYETDANLGVKVRPSELRAIDDPVPPLPKGHYADSVDPRDVNTPDDWVHRHPAMSRLTGRHPFNSDCPAALLLEQSRDLITPNSLHYVRNHFKVPRIDASWHTVEFQGLVDRPCKLSMEDLKTKFKKVEQVVWLSCASNRRGELNAFKGTVGFNFNASCASCAKWGGCYLHEVLEYVGVKDWDDGAQHVEFISGDGYATSLERWRAVDPGRGVMIAWEMNGVPLPPDHGYPVRVIVPGVVGGVSVKWMSGIKVCSKPSTNLLHLFDNIIMPSEIDQKVGWMDRKSEGAAWWKHDYKVYEQPVNSAIIYPRHNDVLVIPVDTARQTYRVEGYASTGGGRKVVRCELSLDGGQSSGRLPIVQDQFFQCKIKRLPEETGFTRSGQYWAWVHWSAEVPWTQMERATELTMCAWNSSMDRQPSTMQWNITGQGNNAMYRVQVHHVTTVGGEKALQFIHPSVHPAGKAQSGWRYLPAEVERRRKNLAKL